MPRATCLTLVFMFYNFIQISFNNILYTITCTHGRYPKVHGVFAEGMAAENDCGGAEASQSWRACFCSSGLYCNDVRREGGRLLTCQQKCVAVRALTTGLCVQHGLRFPHMLLHPPTSLRAACTHGAQHVVRPLPPPCCNAMHNYYVSEMLEMPSLSYYQHI